MKTGRKRKDFTDPSTGLPVIGLTRRPDGRWRLIGTQTTFREPDIQKAIARFRQFTNRKKFPPHMTAEDIDFLTTPAATIIATSAATTLQYGFYFREELPRLEAEKGLWRYVGKQIIERPQWCAKMTGIEWLGWHDQRTSR